MRQWAGLGIVAALAAVFWWMAASAPENPELFARQPPAVFDFFSYYRPNAEYAASRYRDGNLPLWNPWQQLGGPFLATLQVGALYPPNALHLVLPTQSAFALLAALHLGLAALGAMRLAQGSGADRAGASAAGLLFAGSLQLWSAVWTPPTLYAAAWMPLVVAAVVAAAERPSARRAAALASALALQILTGWPYTVAMTAGLGAALAAAILLRRIRRERRAPVAALAALAGGCLIALLLAAPQLLSTLELLTRSARALGTIDEATAGLTSPMHDPRRMLAHITRVGNSDALPGVASPLIAIAALLLRGPGRWRCALLLAIGGLALAASFPGHTPVYSWLRSLPVVGDFRFPFRYRLLTTLTLSVVAGVGLSRLVTRSGRWQRPAAAGMTVLLVLSVWGPMWRGRDPRFAFPRSEPARESRWQQPLEIVAAPEHAGSRSLWRDFGVDKLGQRESVRVLQDLEPLSLASTSRLMQFLATGSSGAGASGTDVVEPVLGAPYSGSMRLPAEAERARLLDLLAVRFAAVRKPPTWLAERWRTVLDGPELDLFENPQALPRAWRVASAESEPVDRQEALERLIAPDFDPRRVALLAASPSELQTPLPADAASHDSGETLILVDEPERVRIQSRGDQAAFLVLADASYPGWECRVDGEVVPTFRANTALRAVAVAAGEHVIEWRYRPASFHRGLVLAALGAIALVVAAVW